MNFHCFIFFVRKRGDKISLQVYTYLYKVHRSVEGRISSPKIRLEVPPLCGQCPSLGQSQNIRSSKKHFILPLYEYNICT